jgi:hypothetical protein
LGDAEAEHDGGQADLVTEPLEGVENALILADGLLVAPLRRRIR